jgi:hypothetical protein
MTGDVAIGITGLTKDYGQGHGLFDLDLEVRRDSSRSNARGYGVIFGLG